MKAQAKKPAVSDAQLKKAYELWKQGGISIWQVKKKVGIKAKVLLPAFEKFGGKKIKSPAAKLPSKKESLQKSKAA